MSQKNLIFKNPYDKLSVVRRCGGIGRRSRLKICRWQHRVGSSPTICIKKIVLIVNDKDDFLIHFCFLI